MFETTRIFTRSRVPVRTVPTRPVAIAMAAICFLSLTTSLRAEPFEPTDIVHALSYPPDAPPELQQLAGGFVERTLPRLISDDGLFAKQLGLSGARNTYVVVDRALPLVVAFHKDVLKFATNKTNPFELINNANNWLKDQEGILVPRRFVFPLEVRNDVAPAEPISWSSVTFEKPLSAPWRASQVGAPKLARAMKLYAAPKTNYFLLWIPDLNRHYLGRVKTVGPETDPNTHPLGAPIILTELFNDPLAQRHAGEEIDISSSDFIERLKKGYGDLKIPERLKPKSSRNQEPAPKR